jgi:hypothetical protein
MNFTPLDFNQLSNEPLSLSKNGDTLLFPYGAVYPIIYLWIQLIKVHWQKGTNDRVCYLQVVKRKPEEA